MANERDAGSSEVAVVDRDVPDAGWQRLDLASLKGLPAGGALKLAGPATAPASVRPARATTLASVPADALVTIAPTGPSRRYAKRGPGLSANDNRRAAVRSAWRDAFFLAVLALVVIGAFWGGRLHAFQRVIVVPGPPLAGNVIT